MHPLPVFAAHESNASHCPLPWLPLQVLLFLLFSSTPHACRGAWHASMQQSRQTEILVHVAATSAAADDARHRALAHAYAVFEPAARLRIAPSPSSCSRIVGGVVGSSIQDGCLPDPETENEAEPAPSGSLPAPASGSFSLLSLSFDGVWDNVQSPAVQHARGSGLAGEFDLRRAKQDLSGEPRDDLPPRRRPYVSPDVYIPDSQPEDGYAADERRSSAADGREISPYGSGVAWTEESQDVGNTDSIAAQPDKDEEDGSDGNNLLWTRCRSRGRGSSPDLSMLPIKWPGEGPPSPKPSPLTLQDLPVMPLVRHPLSQRSANSHASSPDRDSGALKDSLYRASSDVVSTECAAATATTAKSQTVPGNASIDHHNAHIPSSLPEEAGMLVQMEDVSSATQAAFENDGLSPAVQRGVGRADKTPRAKRQRLSTDNRDDTVRLTEAGRSQDSSHARQPQLLADWVAGPAGTGKFDRASVYLPTSSPSAPASDVPRHRSTAQSLRILSPDPGVACDHIDAASLVTTRLAELARVLDMGRRFRPSADPRHGRPLAPMERGCWRLDTSAWPTHLRHDAWAYLAAYVGRGDAGWSVWCSRDPAPHTWLRLHCFAATAGHTYLLLYLASQRHVLPTGAVWLDASGTPAITVPPRLRKTNKEKKQRGVSGAAGTDTGMSTAA